MGSYLFIFESFGEDDTLKIIANILIVVSASTVYFDLFEQKSNIWGKIAFFFGLVLVYVSLFFLKDTYIDYRLEKEGMSTQASVKQTYTKSIKSIRYYALLNYQINQKTYEQSIDNQYLSLSEGDTIWIVYAQSNPEIFKIK